MTTNPEEDRRLLQLTNVSKSFGPNVILRDISFDLFKDDILGVIGPSGGGKTTLLRCLDLLETLDGGSIKMSSPFNVLVEPGGVVNVNANGSSGDQEQISDLSNIRRRIGFVFQSYNLWEDRSVLKNLTMAPRVVNKLSEDAAVAKAEELLTRFGLQGKAASKIWQLSGGQRQRVAIIRALMMEPVLLLCDEVTSALDPVLAYEVLEMIRALRDGGLTMIVVTHHIEFVSALCNRVAYLSGGEIVQLGSPNELLRSPVKPEIETFLKILRFTG